MSDSENPIVEFISAGAEEIIKIYGQGRYTSFVAISYETLRKNKASMLIPFSEKKE